MTKLTLNATQTAVLQSIYSDLEAAYFYGVEVDGVDANLDMGPNTPYDSDRIMGGVAGTTATQQRTVTKVAIARFLAAVVKRLQPAGLTTTVALAKLTALGANGSLTFIDGILTAKVDPT